MHSFGTHFHINTSLYQNEERNSHIALVSSMHHCVSWKLDTNVGHNPLQSYDSDVNRFCHHNLIVAMNASLFLSRKLSVEKLIT